MVARVVWDHEAAGSSPVTSTIGMRRRFIEICGASVIRYALRAIPHNSKCRYGERGAAAAKPKAQIILCVLSSILATQMPCRTPSRSEALRSATAACGGSWRGDPPQRRLSRKAGIMRCCLSYFLIYCCDCARASSISFCSVAALSSLSIPPIIGSPTMLP